MDCRPGSVSFCQVTSGEAAGAGGSWGTLLCPSRPLSSSPLGPTTLLPLVGADAPRAELLLWSAEGRPGSRSGRTYFSHLWRGWQPIPGPSPRPLRKAASSPARSQSFISAAASFLLRDGGSINSPVSA